MAHNTKAFPNGVKNGATKIGAAALMQIDTGQSKAINGDGGGTWSPSSPIIIGGAGIQPQLAAGQYPTFQETIRTFTKTLWVEPVARLWDGTAGDESGVPIVVGHNTPTFNKMITSDIVPNGATITLIRTFVQIINTHASLPTLGPGASVYRIKPTTAAKDVLMAGDMGGGVSITLSLPMNVGLYNALGLTSFDYLGNQNNVVDRTQYDYGIYIVDESGGGAISGNVYYGFQITYTLSTLAPI